MNFEAAKDDYLYSYLKQASAAYYEGNPIITDEQFDYLADLIDFKEVGSKPSSDTKKHWTRMYSLQKYYRGEGKVPLAEYNGFKYESTKLDGAAISALYVDGKLTQVLTRGDGIEGRDITEKFLFSTKVILPKQIKAIGLIQVTGEITALSEVDNPRNYASGALALLDLNEFNTRELFFTAYGLFPMTPTYELDLETLRLEGFKTVADEDWCAKFDSDGLVIRINDNRLFESLGYTSKHPKGAYALKQRKLGVTTKLLSVEWQVGKSGKVTPVAILEPCKIGDATITRATLNNQAFIEALGLELECTVELIKAGDIIPTIVRRVLD
jgi:NAD-dependent DNA ligase